MTGTHPTTDESPTNHPCHDPHCENDAATECLVTGKPLCEYHARRGVMILRGDR